MRSSLAVLAAILMTAAVSPAQTFQVLHTFTGEGDGANPYAALTMDRSGRLYGTEAGVGSDPVFRLALEGDSWVISPLHNYAESYAKLVIGPDGGYYGTTFYGGRGSCNGATCGLVFKLQPPVAACRSFLCPWTETVLYEFSGAPDGGNPYSEVTFDATGNIYGTTGYGGTGACDSGEGCGTVYELTPSQGGWTETVLHRFQGGSDGAEPIGGLIFDRAGNLYGTTANGGSSANAGIIFELTPSAGGWTETIVHALQGSDGAVPEATMISDRSGNLYGTTAGGGAHNGGTVFELSTPGNWSYSILYSLADDIPLGSVTFDTAGNLYGTTAQGGEDESGSVFKLAPSNGGWTYTLVHSFNFGDGGGAQPASGVVFDPAGNLYGTTSDGGGFFTICDSGCGTVYEITP